VVAKWLPLALRFLVATSLWLLVAPLITAYLYHGWMHRPSSVVTRWKWDLVPADIVSGAVVAAIIIISFLSLMSFADFLRVHWQQPLRRGDENADQQRRNDMPNGFFDDNENNINNEGGVDDEIANHVRIIQQQQQQQQARHQEEDPDDNEDGDNDDDHVEDSLSALRDQNRVDQLRVDQLQVERNQLRDRLDEIARLRGAPVGAGENYEDRDDDKDDNLADGELDEPFPPLLHGDEDGGDSDEEGDIPPLLPRRPPRQDEDEAMEDNQHEDEHLPPFFPRNNDAFDPMDPGMQDDQVVSHYSALCHAFRMCLCTQHKLKPFYRTWKSTLLSTSYWGSGDRSVRLYAIFCGFWLLTQHILVFLHLFQKQLVPQFTLGFSIQRLVPASQKSYHTSIPRIQHILR
jgi:hypothetical protein